MRWRRRASLPPILTLVLAVSCGSEPATTAPTTATTVAPTTTMDARVPVVVDTDAGADDALALLYLLEDERLDVRAITVSGTGLVRCPVGAANVAGLVELAGRGGEVPVACGTDRPTSGDREFPAAWRDQADDRYGILPAGTASTSATSATSATELLTTSITAADRDVTVLTLGPLTNLAAALAADPALAAHVERIVMMGGAFDVPGNVALEEDPPAAATEWNLYVDPDAAAAVLASGVPITFVPLDSQVAPDAYVERALARAGGGASAATVLELLTSDPFFTSGQFFLWDPLAAAEVADPAVLHHEERLVAVETTGPTTGRTTSGAGTAATIATAPDPDAFLTTYVATVTGAPPGPISRSPDLRISAGDQRCAATPADVPAGPSVVQLDPGVLVALGELDPGRTIAQIDAFLAAGRAGTPAWFRPIAALQAIEQPLGVYIDLEPGRLDVICIDGSSTPPHVQALASVDVGSAG